MSPATHNHPATDPAGVRGIPLRDRTEDQVRAALSGKAEPEAVLAFVKLHAYACANGLGLTRLGHRCGVPGGTLGPCFNGLYPGDYTAIAARIDAFFYRVQQQELYGQLDSFCPLAITRTLWAVLEKSRITKRIQLINGPEQVGKSRGAVEFRDRNNHGRTAYVKISGGSSSGGHSNFVWSFAQALDLPYSLKLSEKKLRIREALAASDLVIIDEAHLLWKWRPLAVGDFLDYLRTDIHDDGKRGVVIISTNDDFLSQLQDWRKRTRYNIGQLIGRMHNDPVEIDPAEDIVRADVAQLVQRYYQPSKEALDQLHHAAREHPGHFGLLNDICGEAWNKAKAQKRRLTDAILLAELRRTMSTFKSRKELYQ